MAKKEYIDREAFVDHLENAKEILWHDISLSSMYAAKFVDIFFACVKVFPAVDVVPVLHGHWIPQFVSKKGLSNHFVCSECAKSTFTPRKFEMIKYAYCPYCGAKMDGDPYV